jgi:hypothetical protein
MTFSFLTNCCSLFSGTGIDCRGLECVLQNFVNLRRLEAEEQHFQNLLGTARHVLFDAILFSTIQLT